MRAPVIATLLAILGVVFLSVSAFLGVTPAADWTMLAAEASFVIAVIVLANNFRDYCPNSFTLEALLQTKH